MPSIVNRGGLARLRIVNAKLPLVTRLAAYGEIMARAPALGASYLALLENNPDAAARLSKAIDRGAPGAILHLDLSQAPEKAGRLDESVSALERGEELFPFSQEIRKRLVLGYIRQKSYVKAQAAMERYVEDFPDDDLMRGLLRHIPQGPFRDTAVSPSTFDGDVAQELTRCISKRPAVIGRCSIARRAKRSGRNFSSYKARRHEGNSPLLVVLSQIELAIRRRSATARDARDALLWMTVFAPPGGRRRPGCD